MPATARPRRNPIVVALYANAAVLGVILLVILGRTISSGGLAWLDDPAYGQQAQPLAGGGSLFLMPAQLSSNTWGCYVLDANGQTLTAYQYYSGEKLLRLVAARNIRFDRQLGNFQTSPPPGEVEQMVERERAARSGPAEPVKPATTQPTP